MSYNLIESLPLQLFNFGLTNIDASYNRIHDVMPAAAPSSIVLYLNLAGNPGFTPPVAGSLPTWMYISTTSPYQQFVGETFQCLPYASTSNAGMTVIVDASFFYYKNC